MKKNYAFKLFALSMIMTFLGIFNPLFGQYTGSGTFTKITSIADLTDGYYVFAYDAAASQAMNNVHNGTFFANTAITPVGDDITDPSAAIVWKVETTGGNKTIYNEATEVYVSYNGSANAVYATNPAALTNAEMWAITYVSNRFQVQSVNVTGRFLQYNVSSPRFACYTGSQQHLVLYKMGQELPGEEFHETFNTLSNLAGNAAYNDGTQTGSTGYDWSWVACQDGNKQSTPYTIEGVTPVLRHPESYIQATIAGGISKLSLDYKRAYTSAANRVVQVYINDILVASGVNCGGDTELRTLEVSDLNIEGVFTVKIKLQGEGTTNAQTCIDNFKWESYGVQNPLVATPTISPNGGFSTSPKTVTIECDTEGAAIYYTTNGSDPTTASTLYTSPFELNETGTYHVKAIGVKENYDNSPIASALFAIKLFEAGECDILVDFEDPAWSGTSYTPRFVTDQWGEWRVAGVVTNTDANDHAFDTRSIRLRGNATADTLSNQNRVEMNFDRTNGIGTVSFNYASYSSHSGGIINLQYSTDQGETWITAETITNVPSWIAGGSQMLEASFDLDIPGNVRIRITKNSQSGSTSVNIDNICITDVQSNTVSTPTFTPSGGNFATPQNITINCTTEGAVIRYTTNGTDPTTSSPVYTIPINVTATTTIKAMATKAGMDNSAIASATYTFPIEVPSIAAFKAANTVTSSVWYKITGDVTFVYRTGRNIYVKDATGGLLIYDNATPMITHTYTNGDLISGGVVGTCTMYNGLCELIPVANTAPGTAGTPVQPITLTMANLIANFNTYESQLVKLEKIEFAAGTFGTGTAANINIYQNSSQMICRNNYGNITGYVTDPVKRFDVTGFAVPFNTDRQLAPRDVDDIVETQSFTVSVSASPVAGGTVSGGGSYYIDDVATINTVPSAAYNFINWTENGAPVTTNTSFSFTVTGNRTFVANYQIKTYTITSTAGANGTIAPLGTHTYNHGSSQLYTITPNLGYEIDQVLVNGVNVQSAVTGGTYTFTNITANHTISASFKLKQYTLTLNPSTGSVSTPSITVTYNTAIGSIPNATQANCIFKGWFIGTTQLFPYTIWTYTSDQTAIAIFDYPIVATNSNPALGSITPSGTVNYSLGQTVTYTCTPIAGAHITTVVVDGMTMFTGNNEDTEEYTYTFENINDFHTIHVGFAMNCYAMNPNNILGEGTTVTMVPANCVPHGGNVTFNIKADCYQISQILVNGVDQGVSSGYLYSFTMNNVTGSLPLIEVNTVLDQFSIMATPISDPLGAIVPSGLATVNCGTDKTYEFITETGFRVSALFVDNVSVPVPVSRNYTFNNIRANHTIHVEFEEYPQYIIQFGPSAAQQQGGAVFPTYIPNAVNYIAVDSGELVFPFSIVPTEGYAIDKVYVDNVSIPNAAFTGSYTFTNLKANHTIYATFKPIMFTITATANPNGAISPEGAVQVAYGTNQLFHVVPNNGYNISAVIVDGVLNSNATQTGVYNFVNVKENHTISASFVRKTYLITTTAGANGTINPQNPMVPHGNNQTLTFLPQTGFKVDKVIVDGVENPSAAQAGIFTFINVIKEHSISVTFTKIKYTITSTHTDGGVVSPAGIVQVEHGANSPIYVFAAHEGFQLQAVLVNGVNNAQALEDGLYRFMDVTANNSIHVVFKSNINKIIATAAQGGFISPSGIVNVPNGENRIFTFAPTTGYEVARVLVNGINNPDAVQNGYYVFFNVTDDHTIAVQFEKRKYDITFPELVGVLFTPTNGSTTPVEHGGQFTFKIDIQEGYTQSFLAVFVNNIMLNASLGTYSINNITANQDVTISGLELNQYRLTAKASTGGTISPAGTFMVSHGEDKTFVITPNENYVISNLIVNGLSVGALETYTFYNVKSNATIEAIFALGQGISITDETTIQVYSYNNIVTLLNENHIPIKQVDIIDMYGRVVWSGQTTDVKTEITLNVAKGIYGIRITTYDQHIIFTKVIIH